MRITTVGLCLLLFPALVWAGTFRDDFEDGDLEGWTPVNGDWHVKDGKLTCRWAGFTICALLMLGSDDWHDYTIEYDGVIVEKLNDPYAPGHAMRFIAEPNRFFFYTAFWAPPYNNPVIGIVRDNPWTNLFQRGRQLGPQLGTWYHLKVSVEGQDAEFFIDDKLEVTYKHPWIPESGQVGMMFCGGSAEFDNVVITGPDVPNAGPSGLSVEFAGKLATTWGKLKAF